MCVRAYKCAVHVKLKVAQNFRKWLSLLLKREKSEKLLSRQNFQVLVDVLRLYKFSVAANSDAANILALINLLPHSFQHLWYKIPKRCASRGP
jgi:hypothetical protein